ncbi:MAG: SDR family oxidoreductase, partial [Gammaproteobacteria bacterium]|nr:SDR family oxidoreductase [Gammaproteobacteria bacterium]
IARNFAALGAHIGICGRTRAKLDSAKHDLEAMGANVSACVADVCDYDEIASAIDQVAEETGSLDCLVCGAAGNFLAPAENLSPVGFKKIIEIDLVGTFNAARASFEHLKKSCGNTIFISAGQSFSPYYGQAHVGAAKAGVDNLMRSLAMEWGRFGIRCNSLVPGPIENTEGMKRLAPGNAGNLWCAEIPLGRFGRADEIGQAAVFLASQMATFVTGTCLVVDGGQNLPGSGVFSRLIADSMAGGGRE